jgi:hypothetical protein
MLDKAQSRPDLFLLLSLLLVIVMFPVLDHGDFRRSMMGLLMFLPLAVATVRLSGRKGWVWPTVLLMVTSILAGVLSTFLPLPLLGTQVGVAGRLLWVHRVRPFPLPEERPLCHRCSPLYGGQHLPFARDAMVLSLQRHLCLLSRLYTSQRRGNRPAERATVIQSYHPFDRWLRRCRSSLRAVLENSQAFL